MRIEDMMLEVITALTFAVVFIAAFQMLYDVEMAEFKKSQRRTGLQIARIAPSPILGVRASTYLVDSLLRNYCTCRICNYSRQNRN